MRWLILTLTALSVIIILPPIIYHYVYPSWGGDSADHLIYFHNMGQGFPLINFWKVEGNPPLYYGEYFTGLLLNALPFDVNVSFLWFNYIAFVIVVWVVGVSAYLTVNPLAGILVPILVAFGTTKAVGLFVGGTIFDLIAIGVFLPLMFLFLHKSWWVGAFLFSVVFVFWHTNGRYVLAVMPIVLAYELARNKVAVNVEGLLSNVWNNRYLMYMFGMALALIGGFAIGIADEHSTRLVTDAAILIMVFVGGVVALAIHSKRGLVQAVFVAIVVVVSILNVALWFQNNNVVKEADKQAFAYLNGMANTTVSAVVSEDIYKLYVGKQFVKYDADYVIVRSIPMAFRKGYSQEDRAFVASLPSQGYSLVKDFNYGEKEYLTGESIKVDMYGKN